MAQKINLNVTPYFDDFDPTKNYYRVLFNPGRPVQTRELNTLQSILQNQIESFGSNIFKEGSVIIPGNVTFDNNFFAVKLNPLNFGVDISLYLSEFVGKKVTGQSSGISAIIQYVSLPNKIDIEYPTIFVKYIDSDSNNQFNPFTDGESLYCDENITYKNTIINAGTIFSALISTEATSIGSAVSITDGIYFIRGTFVKVNKQTLILNPYENAPSYRVGLKVSEEIINAKDDSSLYDNAKGFTNYAAPGADRLKISTTLTKKNLDDFNDTDFVEILRIKKGKLQKVENKTQYNILKDYLAQRTYDESGNYSVEPFQISVHESLNDKLGNDGLFFDTEKTESGNAPSDDLICVKVSPGKAYVQGYDIEKIGTTILDVNKPRDTETVSTVSIPFEMGNILRVNNVSGAPLQKEVVYLQDKRKSNDSVGVGTTVGIARVYNFNVTDSPHSSPASEWDLYLFDVQTYTKITLSATLTISQLPATSFIKGKSSGASGYSVYGVDGNTIFLSQTSGTFSLGEQIAINGTSEVVRTIVSVDVFSSKDIKSVVQPISVSGFSTAFIADSVLYSQSIQGFSGSDIVTISPTITGTAATITSPGKLFSGIKPGNIIRYSRPGFTTETFNIVDKVSSDGLSINISGISTVFGVCEGGIGTSVISSRFSVVASSIIKEKDGYLFSALRDSNVESVNLNGSVLPFTAQRNLNTFLSSSTLTLVLGDFNLPSNFSASQFQPFDAERYSISYTDGNIEKLTSDKVSISNNQVNLSGISSSKTIGSVYASLLKPGLQSKVKIKQRSQRLNINLSKYVGSGTTAGLNLNDGLTYNRFYGLRVQDEEISLNYPDAVNIIAVYESLDNSYPTFDQLAFSALVNISTNAIIGENIVGSESKATARIISKPGASPNNIEFAYLNPNRFIEGETVTFEESNIVTDIKTIISGSYKDITYDYRLDKGQRNQYYDYSRIVRNQGVSEPSKRLSIVFDYFYVPQSDSGDVFTVLSYSGADYAKDIPYVSDPPIRASDIIDFRPYVPVFTGTSSSPFSFAARNFNSSLKVITSPGEATILGYNYYLPRIDKVYLNKLGEFYVEKGIPSSSPKAPVLADAVMELGTIFIPAYLYSTRDVRLSLVDNRRYTMRDIGKIENRVENLEKVTSLSLLELNTATLQIQDANNLNRFRTGFFVDDFRNSDRINTGVSLVEVDRESRTLTPIISKNSLANQLIPATQITDENLDLSTNFTLLDNNVQKTGNAVTLKYESIDWIEQPLATRVENVNPFHVVVYSGKISLSPQRDSWVRTVQLADRTVFVTNTRTDVQESQQEFTQLVANPNLRGQTFVNTSQRLSTATSQEVSTLLSLNGLASTKPESFMRSRNVEFSAVNLRPTERYYQFLDGNSGVHFIPKLLEIATDSNLSNYGSSGAFVVGETVIGTYDGKNIISFRVAKSNHKSGLFSSPDKVYTQNPYAPSEIVPAEYSQSSKILNIDTFSLSQEAQGKYSGYLVSGAVLVGQTSGSVAYVKDLRLVADNYGSLTGAFFLEDPNRNPAPLIRISTGTKTFKLSSSATNQSPLLGSTSISSGETNYISEGTIDYYQRTRTQTTTNVTTLTINNITNRTTFYDPLAQSFVVGGNIEAPSALNQNEDVNGAFLTAVDVFFANKDSRNAPVTCEIRTVELGTPTRTVLGQPVTLNPDQIQISSDASVATKFTFSYPIFLSPGTQYAVVLLAPESDQYEVWIAEMGENTVNSANVPGVENVRYTRQFAIGRLYKSQNGAEWTPNDYQDMKFKLYKANFTSTTGTVFFHNSTLDQSNGYVDTLANNPIRTIPRQVKVGFAAISDTNITNILSIGRKMGQSKNDFTYGFISGVGGPVSNVAISTSGTNYATDTLVSTFNIIGNGSGLTLGITTTTGGVITSSSAVSFGSGYKTGDVVGIVTSSVNTNTGTGAQFTVTIGTQLDTLYLDNFVGDNFSNDGTSTVVYYDDNNTRVAWAGTVYTSSSTFGGIYEGNTIAINQLDHGMYDPYDKVTLSNVISNIQPVQLTSPLTVSATSVTVASASTTNFGTFEGKPISAINPGYLKIDNEIIKYESVSTNGTISGLSRGRDSTVAVPHSLGAFVYKYELNGVSLRRINTTHDVSDLPIDIDNYYIRVDRTSTNSNIDRSSDRDSVDAVLPNSPLLNFERAGSFGGNEVNATKNILYTSVIPAYETIVPGTATGISSKIRTVSGSSVNGTETPFIDQGYENVLLNEENVLSSTRMICSKINETTYLSAMPRNKSLITALTLSSSDAALSPLVFVNNCFTELRSARFNNPVANYAEDSRVNSLMDDPNASYYVSSTVRIEQPSTSLKVILSAYRHPSADIRVLYSLIRTDSSEVEQSFDLFPGYDNLTIDNNQDGFLDVVNPAKNSGLSDIRVPSSLFNEFREYQYTASDIGPFTGFTIKIILAGTSQAHYPIIKDLRAIALA